MKRFLFLMMISVSVFSIYSFQKEEAKTSLISYYSDKFNGRRTASGEIFDNSKFTAAHRTFPFGTKVKITNIKNGKTCVVIINDRGPFHSSRALDVTKAAFAAIGNISAGVVKVEYEVVE